MKPSLLTQSFFAALSKCMNAWAFDRVEVYRRGVALEYWKDLLVSIAKPSNRNSTVLLLMDAGI
jgi:hypothetical protein